MLSTITQLLRIYLNLIPEFQKTKSNTEKRKIIRCRYNVCLKNGSDQKFMTIYTQSLYSYVHKQLIRTLFEAHIVSLRRLKEKKKNIFYCLIPVGAHCRGHFPVGPLSPATPDKPAHPQTTNMHKSRKKKK